MPSTQSPYMTLSKLFDMSISRPIISVYTANSSTNTIKVKKQIKDILMNINFKAFHD